MVRERDCFFRGLFLAVFLIDLLFLQGLLFFRAMEDFIVETEMLLIFEYKKKQGLESSGKKASTKKKHSTASTNEKSHLFFFSLFLPQPTSLDPAPSRGQRRHHGPALRPFRPAPSSGNKGHPLLRPLDDAVPRHGPGGKPGRRRQGHRRLPRGVEGVGSVEL